MSTKTLNQKFSSDVEDETGSTTSETPSDTSTAQNKFDPSFDEMTLSDKLKSLRTDGKEIQKKFQEYNKKIAALEKDAKQLEPKKKKKKKDQNAPKGRLNAFFFYSIDVRPDEIAKNPNMGTTVISKKIGAMWKELSDEEKAKYENLAEKDKERYLSEKAKYDSKKSQSQSSDDETVVVVN